MVVIDFWTYSCINCLRAIPYVRASYEKYKDQGLVVIGVHTPEFAFEKNIDNVKKAVADLKIDFPVAPADFGISYLGTFYDGQRTLARFVYGVTGCQVVSLTTGGKTKSTIVLGAAAAAAPKLRADMAAVLGVPSLGIGQPVPGTNNGGANK